MKRSDGTPFNRETEEARWARIDALELRLLREKSVFETVREMEELFNLRVRLSATDPVSEDEERTQFLLEMRRRAASVDRLRLRP